MIAPLLLLLLLYVFCIGCISAQRNRCIVNQYSCYRDTCIQDCCSRCAQYSTQSNAWICRPCARPSRVRQTARPVTPKPTPRPPRPTTVPPTPSPQPPSPSIVPRPVPSPIIDPADTLGSSQSDPPALSKSTLLALFLLGTVVLMTILVLVALWKNRKKKWKQFHPEFDQDATMSIFTFSDRSPAPV